MVIRVWHFKVG